MTAEVVNLRRARKDRARAKDKAEAEADANAARHGRTKAERLAAAAEDDRAARAHDAHRRGGD